MVATTIVRGWIEEGGGGAPGLVAALREPRLSRAIAALHRDPGRGWTVAELARESRTSRSVFAERFQSVLGVTPLRYAAELRMRLAAQWIAEDRVPIDALAHRLGYASQAAFSRAFKRITGASPAAGRARRTGPNQGPAAAPSRLGNAMRADGESLEAKSGSMLIGSR